MQPDASTAAQPHDEWCFVACPHDFPPDPRPDEPPKPTAAQTDWDEWIGLHATRNEVAENYAIGLSTHGLDWPHWSDVNAAILRRWTPSGLAYIKERAWKIATQNL